MEWSKFVWSHPKDPRFLLRMPNVWRRISRYIFYISGLARLRGSNLRLFDIEASVRQTELPWPVRTALISDWLRQSEFPWPVRTGLTSVFLQNILAFIVQHFWLKIYMTNIQTANQCILLPSLYTCLQFMLLLCIRTNLTFLATWHFLTVMKTSFPSALFHNASNVVRIRGYIFYTWLLPTDWTSKTHSKLYLSKTNRYC